MFQVRLAIFIRKLLKFWRSDQASFGEKHFIVVYLTPSGNLLGRCLVVILVWALLPACVKLSNRDDLKKYAPFQGVQRIAVFLQHWPVYLQKPDRNDLGEDFIKPQTIFLGPWQRAAQVNPRAVDIADMDDGLMGELLIRILEKKGYQVFLATLPLAGEKDTVEMLMARYQESYPSRRCFSLLLLCSHPVCFPCPGSPPRSCQEVVQPRGDCLRIIARD